MPTIKKRAANREALIRSMEYRSGIKVTSVKTIDRAKSGTAGNYLVTYRKKK